MDGKSSVDINWIRFVNYQGHFVPNLVRNLVFLLSIQTSQVIDFRTALNKFLAEETRKRCSNLIFQFSFRTKFFSFLMPIWWFQIQINGFHQCCLSTPLSYCLIFQVWTCESVYLPSWSDKIRWWRCCPKSHQESQKTRS